MNIGSEIVFKQLLLVASCICTPVTGDSKSLFWARQQGDAQKRFIHHDNCLMHFLSLPSSRSPFQCLTRTY